MQSNRLTAKQVAIGYRRKNETKKIVQGLDLVLKKGELVCLVGPNGTGKSTLLRTLAGLQPALEGEVFLGDMPIQACSPEQRAHLISIVLSTHQGIHLRVRELVEMGRIPHTGWLGKLQVEDHQCVQAALDIVDLQSFVDRFFDQLSDGEKQRVMLARALAQDTPIILLDEPTAHLDVANKINMMVLLQELAHQSHKSIVVSTHDLLVALETADRIWLVTPEGYFEAGLPEELILSGVFQRVFAKEGLSFNNETGGFQIAKVGDGKKVQLEGQGLVAVWTRKALLRKGHQLVHEEPELLVTAQGEMGHYSWTLTDVKGAMQSFHSLAELCAALD